MDLSRFGFIGTDEKCYWGLIGVLWKRPLPVFQTTGQVIELRVRNMTIGFPGRTVKDNNGNDRKILQRIFDGTEGLKTAIFNLERDDKKGLYRLHITVDGVDGVIEPLDDSYTNGNGN